MRIAPSLLAVVSISTLACTGTRPPQGTAQPVYTPQMVPTVGTLQTAPTNTQAFSNARSCNPKEVAPGVIVSFDCGPHADITKAIFPTFKKSFVTGPLPPMVDHRMTGLEGPVKNQGAVGTCTAVSLSSAMDHAIRKMGRGDVVSALHIWSKYAVSSMGVAGDQSEGERIALEPSWPYDPAKACKMLRDPFDSCSSAYKVSSGSGDLDPQIRAEKAAANNAGRYTVSAIEKLQSNPPNLDEMSAVLAGGDAIWVSFWVDSDAWTNSALLQGAVLPHYEQRESTGHAVLLAGYRWVGSQKQFLIHNSWGTKWGDGGYAWITDTTVSKHLRAAYKVRVSDGGGGPSPNPGGACPQGQVPDSVLGTCSVICSSGSAPAAGVCLPSIPGLGGPGGLPSIPGMPSPGSLPFPFPIPGITPPSQPQNTAACAQGQAPDVLTGQCAALCPSGTPPAGGMCLPALPKP
ncbi:MAG: C1 family peptidase [Polyangiaceae bacterium]|nr:C1 family peptidase [Polyangiaceae bacterium]